VTDPADSFATPRVAAGALFCDGDRLMLVRKTYGNGWDIPGGYAEAGESPAAACRRELKEELALDREPEELLAVDWAPHPDEGDKILYVFSCGPLDGDDAQIRLCDGELDRWEWVPVSRLGDYVIPRLARRLAHAYEALAGGAPIYLEHGEPSLRAPRTGHLAT
jgi:8-oxo-dGTP diphosphatase